MRDTTYLFYDIETTGLNKCFDQALQFAAIRTDTALNELARYEIQIKLNPDVIPSPYAVITHRIGPSQFQQGKTELDAIQEIHHLLNTPNTISVGYNSLGFDDEFLRFSFYRNLLPPYTHQYANRCGRMDIYPITLLYYLFKKEALNWPENNLKLEQLSKENNLAVGMAHNAMVDVEATLALAKKLSQDPAMWAFVTGYFQKPIDDERCQKTESVLYIGNQPYPMGLLAYGKIGAKDNYVAPVIALGSHLHYKNQLVFLRLDTPELMQTTLHDPAKTTRVIKKRLAEPPLFLPFKERYTFLLSDDRQHRIKANQTFLSENTDVFHAIKKHHQHEKYPEHPDCDIDAALYHLDFPTGIEEKLFREFHAASPEKKCAIAEKFPNPLRKAQAHRIVQRHFPEVSVHNDTFCIDTIDFRGEKKYTLAQALADLADIEAKKELDDEQKKLLSELKVFYQQDR